MTLTPIGMIYTNRFVEHAANSGDTPDLSSHFVLLEDDSGKKALSCWDSSPFVFLERSEGTVTRYLDYILILSSWSEAKELSRATLTIENKHTMLNPGEAPDLSSG
jgi:hypothetical protein